jgi:hypothetical protein
VADELNKRISQQNMSIHDLKEANLRADRVRNTEYDLSHEKKSKLVESKELKWRSDSSFS